MDVETLPDEQAGMAEQELLAAERHQEQSFRRAYQALLASFSLAAVVMGGYWLVS